MGTLQWEGSGRWKLTVEVGAPGSRVRRVRRFDGAPPTAKGKPPRKVRERAAEIEVELAQHRLHLAPERVTVGQAVEAWWAWWALSERSPTTQREYRRLIDRRIVPGLGAVHVERLTAAQLTAWYQTLAAGGLAAGSVRQVHAVLRQVLAHAQLHQWAARNAALAARLPEGRAKAARLPTVEDIARLVEAAGKQTPMARRALVVSFGLGVRRGELAGLRASRILWDQAEVLVDTSVTDKRSGHVVKGTKSHQARRVPLRPWVAAALQEQLLAHRERAARRGVEMAADPWVWSQAVGAGGRPRPEWFTLVFTRARKDAGLEGVRLHDLRHGFASWLLAEGVPITEVAFLLGHSSPAVTARIYAHADPTRRGAHAAMERLPEPGRPAPPALELPEG